MVLLSTFDACSKEIKEVSDLHTHTNAQAHKARLDVDASMIFVVAKPTKQPSLLLHKGSRLYNFSVQQSDTSPAKH